MLKFNEKENIIAYILDKNGKKVNTVSLDKEDDDDENNNNVGLTEIELHKDFKFQLAPRLLTDEKERTTLFIAGESGSGKSYLCRETAKAYHKLFPKNPIYLISYLEEDKTLDEYKKIIRMDITPEVLDNLLRFDLKSDFANCLVIFDDIDSIDNKHVKDKIYGLINKLFRLGRHPHTSIIYSGHELYDDDRLKGIFNECDFITFFPKYLNFKKLRYLFEEYMGLSKEQIAKIKSIKKTRPITYCKGFPKLIMSDHMLFELRD